MATAANQEVVQDDQVSHTSVDRAPWSPAQLVSLAIGILFVVLGGMTLAKTGINLNQLTAKAEVLGLQQSTGLAFIELVIGLALVAAGALPGAGRGTMVFFGVVMLGFGIVIAAQPSTFEGTLGTTGSYGVLLIICGVLLLLAAMVAPTIFNRGSRSSARKVDSSSVR